MAWVATAIVGSGIIGAGASLYGANKQADAANQAANLQKGMFDENVARTQPFVDFGSHQLPTLNKLLTPGASQTDTLSKLPGFQFGQQWGQKAITNQGTMNGLSGNTLRAGADYATGSAQQYFGNYVNQLLSAAGIGSNAAAGLGNQSVNAGNSIGQSLIGAGTATAAGALGGAASLASGVNGMTNYLTQQDLINKLTNGGMYGPSSVGGNPLTAGGIFKAG